MKKIILLLFVFTFINCNSQAKKNEKKLESSAFVKSDSKVKLSKEDYSSFKDYAAKARKVSEQEIKNFSSKAYLGTGAVYKGKLYWIAYDKKLKYYYFKSNLDLTNTKFVKTEKGFLDGFMNKYGI